ncbi:MAG: sialate O-acetylesterase, partial [Chitinophagaceae bacterium]
RYHVPVGIINASAGGTPIEAWISEEGLNNFPSLQTTAQKNKDTAYISNANSKSSTGKGVRNQSYDKGMLATPKWFETSYTPKGWRPINVPGYWEDQGLKDFNGVIWYRKEVDIPSSMIGKPARAFLGRIVDADILYINGKQVGNTTYMYPQRRYHIAPDVLRAGKNIFVIRVTNNNGKGGFVPDKPYYIFAGKDTVDLKGTWEYKMGEVYPPRIGGFVGGIVSQNQPTALYNAMVAPAIHYSIKGFLWYQGEANTGRAEDYKKLQPAQIADWRNKWRQGNLPFVLVQLPGFMDYNYLPSESQWAQLRDAQLTSLSVPNTAMVVAIDLGEWNDIHPDNKKDVGKRLALAAQKLAYGENIVYSGPLVHSATNEGNKIIVSFTNTGSGLITKDGEAPEEFAIAGPDKKFVWAKATIDGDKVIVFNDQIDEPRFVRYAWADNPVNPNLYNKEGLPASPFESELAKKP